jgi:hypothetical protein
MDVMTGMVGNGRRNLMRPGDTMRGIKNPGEPSVARLSTSSVQAD